MICAKHSLIWQRWKGLYVPIDLQVKKCHCGAVGWITESIPMVLGSILAVATFFIVNKLI